MTENNSVFAKLYDFYQDRLGQVEIHQWINRGYGILALSLAFATSNPGLWVGLGLAVVDSVYNEIRLRARHDEVVAKYHGVKNAVSDNTSVV